MNKKILKEVIIEEEMLKKYQDNLENEVNDLEKLVALKKEYLSKLKSILKSSENK